MIHQHMILQIEDGVQFQTRQEKEPTFTQWQYEKTMRQVNDRPGLGYAYALSPDLHSTSQFVVAAPDIDITVHTNQGFGIRFEKKFGPNRIGRISGKFGEFSECEA
jgi:hypothetical protein